VEAALSLSFTQVCGGSRRITTQRIADEIVRLKAMRDSKDDGPGESRLLESHREQTLPRPPQFNQLRRTKVTPEKRLMLSVLLLGVAQQDPKNVRWLDSKIITRKDIAIDAARFIRSDEFNEMCKAIRVNAELLRSMEPKQAMKLFELITSDNKKEPHERN